MKNQKDKGVRKMKRGLTWKFSTVWITNHGFYIINEEKFQVSKLPKNAYETALYLFRNVQSFDFKSQENLSEKDYNELLNKVLSQYAEFEKGVTNNA